MSPQGNLCFLGGSLEEVRGNKKNHFFTAKEAITRIRTQTTMREDPCQLFFR
jgi:hypothetical protein